MRSLKTPRLLLVPALYANPSLLRSSLYAGKNDIGQRVLTWYSKGTATSFHGDLMVFVNRLVELGHAQYPTDDDYIGYVSLGTEAYWSAETVTFHVPSLAFNVETK